MKIYPEKEDTQYVKTTVKHDEAVDADYMRKEVAGFGVDTNIKPEHIEKYKEVGLVEGVISL